MRAKSVVGDDVDFHTIARMAAGASGAELANIINEGALRAVATAARPSRRRTLRRASRLSSRVIRRKNAVLSDHEKRVVSYHEIGHALVAALQTDSAPVQKITIIPRTSGALGYTPCRSSRAKEPDDPRRLLAKLATLTGGRAAEEVAFGRSRPALRTTSSRPPRIARAMIAQYGMTDLNSTWSPCHAKYQYLGGDTRP